MAPTSPAQPSNLSGRHYGLDWLRIGAFGLLILFHLGLYFAPNRWVVNSPQAEDWVRWPIAAVVPWRLSVLFAVSGYATAAMLHRFPSLPTFLAQRSKRLLVPLAFGMLVIVPPQEWVRIKGSDVDLGYIRFLENDVFSFSTHAGAFMPGWEHLWFLPYLWAYTMLLVAGIALRPSWQSDGRRAAVWLSQGQRIIWVPAVVIVLGMAALIQTHVQGLVESAAYIPAFVLGFAYAHFSELRAVFGRHYGRAGALSAASLALLWILMALGSESQSRLEKTISLGASALMSWTMILFTFHFADRFLNRDHKWRGPLAAAVFPAYIVHQTVIVLTGWQLREAGVVGVAAFLIQMIAVVGGCLFSWQLAAQFPMVGVMLGMPPKAVRREPSPSSQPSNPMFPHT